MGKEREYGAGMSPNPMKSKCRICGIRPTLHSGMGLDSSFVACGCKGKNGGYLYIIYSGWELPKQWKLGAWYASRFYTAKLAKRVLAV